VIRDALREALYHAWRLRGRVTPPLPATGTERLTVLIPAYHARRSRNIAPLVRACLQCRFVERVVVSNHNPDTSVAAIVPVRDPRVTLIEHGVRRGCGYIWHVASEQPGACFLVIDDDQLLYPAQIAALFRALVADPSVPHGLCGGSVTGEYLERCEREVDVLYNAYAVTRAHLDAFHRLSRELVASGAAHPDEIEHRCDDVVISRSGGGRARIHDVGFILRCRTGGMEGVAIFREPGFDDVRVRVDRALAEIQARAAAGNPGS